MYLVFVFFINRGKFWSKNNLSQKKILKSFANRNTSITFALSKKQPIRKFLRSGEVPEW